MRPASTLGPGGDPNARALVLVVLFLDPVRKGQPRIPSRPVDGDGRLRERGIGERADRDRDRVRPTLGRPEDRRAAVRAEAKRPLLAGVRDTDVLRVPSGDVDPILRPPRLHPERAAGPTLAGEAVTHRDPHGIALRRHPELAAAASASRLCTHRFYETGYAAGTGYSRRDRANGRVY